MPFPRQLALHAAAREADEPGGPDQIGYGGARGPGKSHGIFAQLALDDCQRRDGLKCLYLRKVGKQAREQLEDLRRKVLWATPNDYNRSTGVITFPSDSRIIMGHFRTEGDIDNYLGLEYDVVAIEEATSLTLTKYRALRDSNRTSRDDWRPRIYNSTNPGGVGHIWYKKTFVLPWQRGEETYTRFIPGTIDDNPFIDAGYQRKLEENTGWRLRAYRWGDWDIAAGQFFSTWREDVHVIEPFQIPAGWRVWAAMDYGFTHPTVVHFFAESPGGDVYVVDEHAAAKWLPPRHADAIRAMLQRNGYALGSLYTFVAGHDVFANRGDRNARTIAEQYQAEGIRLSPANVDRINGAAEVLKRLGDPDENLRPTVYIFDRCRRLIETLPVMEHDPHRPEDVLKVDVDEDGNGGDDAYDSCRYGLMVRQGGAQVMRQSPLAGYRG